MEESNTYFTVFSSRKGHSGTFEPQSRAPLYHTRNRNIRIVRYLSITEIIASLLASARLIGCSEKWGTGTVDVH
jgi:hypothetical protein